MKRWTKWALSGALLAAPLLASAQVDLTTLDRGMTGPRSLVLVLGTAHLSGFAGDVPPASLEGLMSRLAAFKPDILTIENRSGEECDLVARHPLKYGSFGCKSTEAAKAATGLDVPAAMAEIDKTLKAWPAEPTAAQRRHLAALLLAANERDSAYVQWLQLPEGERHAGDGLDAKLVDMLIAASKAKSETTLIAARLAARLGLQRLHYVDNHTGDDINSDDDKTFWEEMALAWKNDGTDFGERDKAAEALKKSADLLPLYRYLNTPDYQSSLADANVGQPMRFKSPRRYPQMWVAGWEIRNLRMVANIRETFRERPGARVLVIVGAAHKSFFDSWLGQLQGVDIVDAVEVLN